MVNAMEELQISILRLLMPIMKASFQRVDDLKKRKFRKREDILQKTILHGSSRDCRDLISLLEIAFQSFLHVPLVNHLSLGQMILQWDNNFIFQIMSKLGTCALEMTSNMQKMLLDPNGSGRSSKTNTECWNTQEIWMAACQPLELSIGLMLWTELL